MSQIRLNGMISVVIPMYNSQETIEKALNSIKNQTELRRILEIIVINDGSTDNSSEIVEKYIVQNPELPIILINKQNNGVSSARNIGMEISKGEYIALLDSDDEWLLRKTEIQMKVFDSNPNIDFLGTNYNDKELKILTKKIDKLHHASVKELCLKFFPVTPSAIFRKSIIDKIGYFNENQGYAEDGNYFLKICSEFNYYHLPQSLVLCGQGKPEFGYSGLSSNLKDMYEGNVNNIRELRENNRISRNFYLFLRAFYFLKYIRRIVLTKIRQQSKVSG